MKISITTPSFNQAKFIRQTLNSVLMNQDYDSLEYIVVDGLSNDSTFEILKEYKQKYFDKFNFIYEKDSGQSNAINKGFQLVKGDIIGWINSDDYYEDNIFQFIVNYFQEHPDVDMIYGKCNIVDENGQFIKRFEDSYGFKKCKIDPSRYDYNILLNVYSGLIPQQTVFFRRNIFDKVGYLDESYHFAMDYEYWLRIGRSCHIERVDKLLANFRFHSEAKTNFRNNLGFIKELVMARKHYSKKIFSVFTIFIIWILIKTYIKIALIDLGLIRSKA